MYTNKVYIIINLNDNLSKWNQTRLWLWECALNYIQIQIMSNSTVRLDVIAFINNTMEMIVRGNYRNMNKILVFTTLDAFSVGQW